MLFFPFLILDIKGSLNSLHMYTQWRWGSVLTEIRCILLHLDSSILLKQILEKVLLFFFYDLVMICPDNLFVKLTLNHCQH